MKDKLIQIRVDAEFLSKLEYLQHINGFISIAETVRNVIEKEWRKEITIKKGKWDIGGWTMTCSECESVFHADIMRDILDRPPKFCPNCGAKMQNIFA